MAWADPYFPQDPDDGVYRVSGKSLGFVTPESGAEHLRLIGECLDAGFEGMPIQKNIFYMTEMGENELKGIIQRVAQAENPNIHIDARTHLIAGVDIFQAKQWLESRLVGGIYELRVERQISAKNNKEYVNKWFHGVVGLRNAQPAIHTAQNTQQGLGLQGGINPDPDMPF